MPRWIFRWRLASDYPTSKTILPGAAAVDAELVGRLVEVDVALARLLEGCRPRRAPMPTSIKRVKRAVFCGKPVTMLKDPISIAWQNAPMGEPLSAEENDLAEEGLAAIETGEVMRGDEVSRELAARHRTAG